MSIFGMNFLGTHLFGNSFLGMPMLAAESWDFKPTWFGIIISVLVVVVALVLFVKHVTLYRGDRKVIFLELLRLLIVALLILTLFAPEKVMRSNLLREPVIAILVDKSASMTTRDVNDGSGTILSREEWVSQQMDSEFWGPLKETYKVVVEEFGAAKPEDDDPGTDLNEALTEVVNRHDSLRSVLLLSDGDYTAGKNPNTAAAVMQGRDVPLYAVQVGSDRYLADIDLADVKAPSYGLVNESLSLPFTVQSRMREDVDTKVELIGPNGIIAEKEIRLPAGAQVQESILLEPDAEGTFSYSIRVPVLGFEEAFTNNNEIAFNIAMRQTTNKVLVIDSHPRWEYRFLRNALSRDPTVKVDCLLYHPGMKMGGGSDYLDSFPDKEVLSSYDVVFLGDVGIGPNELSLEQVDWLKGLVEEQGSGLVFLPGQRGGQSSLFEHPIQDINPVIMDERNPKGSGLMAPSKLVLTSRGSAHLLTLLAGESESNASVWKSLPGFYWNAPVLKARAGSTVLAVHENTRGRGGRLPLLVTKDAGYGKTLFMGTDSAWRWRRGVEDRYHYRFWRQVVRWMAHQRHLVNKEGIRFFYSPEAPKRGEPVFLHATVFDRSGYPLQEGTVKAKITDEQGKSQSFNLSPEDGGWGVFTGSFTPTRGGNFTVDVFCEDVDRKIDTKIQVASIQRERTGRPARGNVLREIGAITSGGSYPVSRFNDMFASLQALDETKIQETRFQLWSDWRWMGIIVFLLCLYWVSRKIMGMI